MLGAPVVLARGKGTDSVYLRMSQQTRNRYMMVVVAVTGIVCAYAFHRDLLSLYNKYCEREAAVQRLRQSVREAQALEDDLSRRVDGLDHDAVEMEAAIRRNKELIREGETIYRVELPPEIGAGGTARSQ